MSDKIVIIGANASGINAANAARKNNRKAEIILIENDKSPAYSRCGIPYVLAKEIPNINDLIIFPPDHYKMMKLDLRTETKAINIDPDKKSVQLKEKDGKIEKETYDALILTMGATPFIIPIKGHDLPGVFAIRTLEDGRIIQ